MRVVGAVDEVGDVAAHVGGKLLEETGGFLVGERAHCEVLWRWSCGGWCGEVVLEVVLKVVGRWRLLPETFLERAQDADALEIWRHEP